MTEIERVGLLRDLAVGEGALEAKCYSAPKEASFRPRPSARTCLGNGNGSSLEAISFWLLESDSVKRHTAIPHRTRKFRRNAKRGADLL